MITAAFLADYMLFERDQGKCSFDNSGCYCTLCLMYCCGCIVPCTIYIPKNGGGGGGD